MNVPSVILVLSCATAATLVLGGCREEEGDMMRFDERTSVPDGGSENAPDTWRVPPMFPSVNPTTDAGDDAPDTLPSGVDPETFATDVIMTAGCGMDQDVVAVAANRNDETMCESLSATAACYDAEGDYFEVGASFLWTSLRPDIVSVPHIDGTDGTLAYLHGNRDIFDEGGVKEPTSTVIACTMNDCSDDDVDDGCQAMVCATATVASVVNLEGGWLMSGISIDPGTVIHPLQFGRTFTDPTFGLVKGTITGTKTSFEIGDYRYDGDIAPDRSHISGHVTELMGYSVIGPWTAVRITD